MRFAAHRRTATFWSSSPSRHAIALKMPGIGVLSAMACFLKLLDSWTPKRVKFGSMGLRIRFLLPILIGAISLSPNAARAGDTQFEKTPYGMGAEVVFGLVKYHNACVWLRVLFISGDFFKDLQEHKTRVGIEFRRKKDKTVYVNFPDHLLVDLEASPHKCAGEITPPDYAAGLLEAPSFEVAWKRGDEARPIELVTTEEHHHPLAFGWSYLLSVPSENVPLTDSLVIDVSLRRGICRTHLTANLDSRQRKLFPTICN